MDKAKVAKGFPATLGECVDVLYDTRAQRLAANRVVNDMKVEESKLKEHVIKEFGKTKLDGARGKNATCSIERPMVPMLKDFEKFMAWVVKEKAYDLLFRSVNAAAWRARYEAGVKVAGIEPMEAVVIHLTKVGKKSKRNAESESEDE